VVLPAAEITRTFAPVPDLDSMPRLVIAGGRASSRTSTGTAGRTSKINDASHVRNAISRFDQTEF
jgi:hypothetical protein